MSFQSSASPAVAARILRDKRREEKRRKREQRSTNTPLEPLRLKVWASERALLYWLQEHRLDWWVGRQALRVTSAKPFQDVCIVTAVCGTAALFSMGFPFFWMVTYATAMFFLVNLFVRCPRPQVLDQRLVPLTRTSTDAICQEAYSATIVFGTLALFLTDDDAFHNVGEDGLLSLDWAYIVQQVMLLATVMFLSWTRLAACAKYPSQIAIAWIAAVPHLIMWHAFPHLYYWRKRLFRAELTAACFVGAIAVLYFAYLVEHNQSSLVGVNREEYLRVLGSIMAESSSSNDITARQNEIQQRGEAARTDSFVYMLRSMERREKRRRRRRDKLAAAAAGISPPDSSTTGTDTESDRRREALRAAKVMFET